MQTEEITDDQESKPFDPEEWGRQFDAEAERSRRKKGGEKEAVQAPPPPKVSAPPAEPAAAEPPPVPVSPWEGKTRYQLQAEWQRRVRDKVADGMTHGRAVAAVNQEAPGLREAMIASANPRPAEPAEPEGVDCATYQVLSQQWRDAIASYVASGMTANKAVSAAAKEYKGLRERLCAAGNAHAKLVREHMCTCPRKR